MTDTDAERKPKLSEYEYISLLSSRILKLQQEVAELRDTVAERDADVGRLRDSLAERDELIEAFQHTIEYIHTQSQGRTE